MTNWIISANPKVYDYDQSFTDFGFIDWRQKNPNFAIGDVVFIYSSSPLSILQYECLVQGVNLIYPNVRDDAEYFYDLKEYKKAIGGKFMRLSLVRQVDNPKLSLDKLLNNGLNIAPRGPIKITPLLLKYIILNFSDDYQTEIFPEVIINEDGLFEGVKKSIFVNKYERNSIARKKCIEFHGLNCQVCYTNFAIKYGKIGEDFIHIHHLIPIHTIAKQYRVDYKNDLIPVCPNCHAMLHRKINGKEPSVNDLREIIKNQSYEG